LWISFAVVPVGAVRLRYSGKPGKVYRYKTMVVGAGENKASMMNQPMRMQMTMMLEHTTRVLKISPEALELEVASVQGSSNVTSMGQQTKTPIPKTRIVMRITPLGKVLETKTGSPSGTGRMGAMGGMMGNSPVNNFLPIFPERDVKPGDTWSEEAAIPVYKDVKLNVRMNSKLLGLMNFRGHKCAKIQMTYEIPMDDLMPPEAQTQTPQMTMTMKGKATGRMTYYFDYERGHEVYSEGPILLAMKMNVSAQSSSGEQQDMETSTVMKMNCKTVLIEKK